MFGQQLISLRDVKRDISSSEVISENPQRNISNISPGFSGRVLGRSGGDKSQDPPRSEEKKVQPIECRHEQIQKQEPCESKRMVKQERHEE